MRLLINTTNLNSGGGVQVGVSFLSELIKIKNNYCYFLLLSVEVAAQLVLEEFDRARFEIVILNPKKGILNRVLNARQLSKYEQLFKPDLNFSVFGPVLWKSRAPHLVGFAIPHLIYPESPFFNNSKPISKLKVNLLITKFFFKRNSNFLVTETIDASNRLSNVLKIGREKVYTVSNTVNEAYKNFANKNDLSPNFDTEEIRLITLSSFYPHKNISIIRNVILELKKLNVKAKFFLTIDPNIFEREFSECDRWVHNYGPRKVEDCPELYKNADVMFLPTLLECFSASYAEAMCMQRPILTSDLSFARDICKNAALYFNPLDPKCIADKIMKIKNDQTLYKELVINGNKIFSKMPSSKDRAISYLNILEKIKYEKYDF